LLFLNLRVSLWMAWLLIILIRLVKSGFGHKLLNFLSFAWSLAEVFTINFLCNYKFWQRFVLIAKASCKFYKLFVVAYKFCTPLNL